MKNSICTITAYFGKFNNYFKLWLKSCSLNDTIDFLIFTDIEYDGFLPNNVKMIKMSLGEIERRAIDVLGFNVRIRKPYKLCDFRPLYGLIFKDYLAGYEYWGHNDMDMIYGDIRKFLVEYSYEKYDKFLPLGHLAFYKNNCDVNQYFKMSGSKCGSYTEVLLKDNVLGFDEVRGIGSIMMKNNKKLFFKRIFADIATIYSRYVISVFASVDGCCEKNYKYQIFYWENGHLYREYYENKSWNRQEFVYIHFQKRPNFEVDFDSDLVDSFYITPKGFFPKKEKVSIEVIQQFNPYKSFVFEKGELILWVIKKVLKKVHLLN